MNETLCFSIQSPSPNLDDLPLRCDGCETVSCVVGSVKCEVRSVKCEVWSVKFQVRSAKSAVWSVECEDFASSLAEKIKRLSRFGVRSAQCEVWGLECEGSSGKWEVWSVKCEVWSVKFGVWSFKFGVRRVQWKVWSVKTLLCLSLKKSNGCRGKDTVGTGCLWTIGHLCLGNFRRRLARVYVRCYISYKLYVPKQVSFTWCIFRCFFGVPKN